MGVFAPWFLLGLAALGVPVYLHLLRRNTSTPQPFSSLRFFEARTISSVRHRRLRYLLLLALRLALLLLVVLAFAQPYLSRPVADVRSQRLELLLIDRSFSMRAGSRLEDAKRGALALLERRAAGERAQVMAFGSRLQVLTQASTDGASLRAAVSGIEADDSRGNLAEVANAVRAASENVAVPIEVHLFSDLQRSNLPANFEQLTLPEGVTLVLHPVTGESVPNWTVESVSAPARLWGSGRQQPVPVRAIITGFATPAASRSVSLLVNGRTAGTQQVAVPAGGRVSVSFALPQVPYGFSRCEVRIDPGDVLPEDDGYRFSIERGDPQQVLFVRPAMDLRAPLYFGDALAAAGGAQFTFDSATMVQAAALPLKPYAFVVLSNLPALPTAFETALLDYVRAGGSVLVALGTGTAARVPVFAAGIQQTHNYSGGWGDGRERFIGVGDIDAAQAWAGDTALWSGVKFFYAQRVDEANAQVVARLSDGTPLLLEKRIGEGRVLLFASGLDGLTNDLPLHPAFVALVAQLAAHLSALSQDPGARVVDSLLPLHTAGEHSPAAAGGVEVLDPAGRRPLSLAEAASAPSLALSQAGYYQLRRANGRAQLIAVNVDPRESDLEPIPEEELALWQRRNTASAGSEAGPARPSPRQPYPLAWFILLLALLVALAHSWVSALHQGTQREQS